MTAVTEAPYDRNGNLLRTPTTVYEWRPNNPFRMTLTLTPIKGAGHVIWTDSYGRRYPMFISDLTDLIRKSTVSGGVTISWWTVTKRSESYGIRRLAVDGKAPTRNLDAYRHNC